MKKSLRWIGCEVCKPPSFDGTNYLRTFIIHYQGKIPEKDRLGALNVALRATPARWWSTHKKHITDWSQCKMLMEIRFAATQEYFKVKYTG